MNDVDNTMHRTMQQQSQQIRDLRIEVKNLRAETRTTDEDEDEEEEEDTEIARPLSKKAKAKAKKMKAKAKAKKLKAMKKAESGTIILKPQDIKAARKRAKLASYEERPMRVGFANSWGDIGKTVITAAGVTAAVVVTAYAVQRGARYVGVA